MIDCVPRACSPRRGEMTRATKSRLTAALEARPTLLAIYATTTAFGTYFCMYAFRKPFAAGTYVGAFAGTEVTLKTAFVISQLIGYTLSKFLGIRINSEMPPAKRLTWLVGLILAAEAALLLFGALPPSWAVLALLLNGVPLGMVWGLCVSYLEGRRTSDFLLAGLSCSFIVASGMVKDVGRWLLTDGGVPEMWMPAITGLVFLVPFLVSAYLLDQVPPPSADDIALRTPRHEMQSADRWHFLRTFFPGLVLLIGTYLFLTAFRDFRDNYGIEIFRALGESDTSALFTRTETPVAFGVMIAVAALTLIKHNKLGLIAAFVLMLAGMGLVALGTLALEMHLIGGLTWMIATGLGSYLAYVPFNAVLFERLIAYTRVTSTAVFTIYLADAVGYTGSVATQLYRDVFFAGETRLEFFVKFCYTLGIGSLVTLTLALVYFLRWRPKERPPGYEDGPR